MPKSYLTIVSSVILVSMMSCAPFQQQGTAPTTERYFKPLNDIQSSFYDIQAEYDAEKYSEVITSGEVFLKNYKRDILAVAVKYYLASSYHKLDRRTDAEVMYKDILRTNPEDEWGKLATVGLQELKDVQQ